ncbi:ATP-binding cassette domain-containing protein [Dethiosulfovibrio salsuginis]|uniref:Nickel transport system ATP-binding protein n=1 Tax=Dethiosulfovibrio salsuginis TaxID=561720 RepID=A0A1X7J584_9BACT|nr:ATP-binding cassette domain-containing protein [Dethiosulfovibrio salsuginis]SMG22893.1 nickel transport system ATP-binding protein [Dethiosulfovibrio salsuginis]
MTAFIAAENLWISHGAKDLVKGISFQGNRGEVLGILGESGCGKSLSCLGILGLLPPGLSMSGSITLEDKPFDGNSCRSRLGSSIAAILQNPMSCFDPVFTVRDHFQETAKAHGLVGDDRFYLQSLEEVGLGNEAKLLDMFPFQLSGGMLQRIMIALALVADAPFLVADEPTTDLDVINQARILNLLEDLRIKRNMGMILVTHDLGVLAKLADRIMVMKDGEALETGTTEEIFSKPSSDYTAKLVSTHFRLCGETERMSAI